MSLMECHALSFAGLYILVSLQLPVSVFRTSRAAICHLELIVYERVVGIKLSRGLQMSCSLFRLSLLQHHLSQLVMSLGIVWIQCEHRVQQGEGLFFVRRLRQCIRQIVLRIDVTRIVFNSSLSSGIASAGLSRWIRVAPNS